MYLVIRKTSSNTEDYSVVAFSYKQEDAEKSLERLSKNDEYVFELIDKEEES